MSTGSPKRDNQEQEERRESVKTFYAPGMPKPEHPAIADALSRLEGVPGYNRQAVQNASIALTGAGGIGSWFGMGVVRSGLCKHLIVIDGEAYDLSNASRQLLYTPDIGAPKAFALSRNLAPHAVRQLQITAIALPFEEALKSYPLAVDLAVFGVDNTRCRLQGALWARRLRIPAIFTMLSLDGTRCESFLQGPNPKDACLHCCFPELDPARAMPCAFASITSCFLASAYTLFFAERALMGWDRQASPFNFRSADLQDNTPERTGRVRQRADCPVCSALAKENDHVIP